MGWKQMSLALLAAFALAGAAEAQDSVYRSGSTSYNGHAVNAYTNAGATHYRRTMRSRGGAHYNVVPFKPKASRKKLGKLKIPKVYSFKESAFQKLPTRYVTIYTREVNEEGRSVRTPKQLNLSKIISQEAKRNNIDPLLVEILIRHESNFRPYAISRTGARGLMQLMPGTATMLGVRNSYSPKQNVAGGTRYLAEQLSRFKNLGLALAAYNAGPGAVRDYGGIPPYAETRNYVASIAREYSQKRKKKKASE